MKREKRKVTVEQEIYIADDGSEFLDYDECERYEMKLIENSLVFFNKIFVRCDFDSCSYIKVEAKEDIEKLVNLCKWYCVSWKGLHDVGVYMYDTYSDQWINITQVIEKINQKEKA